MKTKTETTLQGYEKQYNVVFTTIPIPDSPAARIQLVINGIAPVINQIITDAMTVAIGTWPTPEKPRKKLK